MDDVREGQVFVSEDRSFPLLYEVLSYQ
jgi:hypothetical protein